jgi:hypothetical protein
VAGSGTRDLRPGRIALGARFAKPDNEMLYNPRRTWSRCTVSFGSGRQALWGAFVV